MYSKRFFAKNMRIALNMVRDELGAHALIYSQRNLHTGVEIIAGHEPVQNHLVDSSPDVNLDAVGSLKKELEQVKHLLKNEVASLVWDKYQKTKPLQAQIIQNLRDLGFTAELSHRLVESLMHEHEGLDVQSMMQAVKQLLSNCLTNTGHLLESGLGRYVLLGSHGVGKTLLCIKWAMQAAFKWTPNEVVVLSLDTQKMGSGEHLRMYGRILNIVVHTVHSKLEFLEFMKKYADKKLVLIDTPGIQMNQKNEFLDFLEEEHSGLKNIWVMDVTQQQEVIENALSSIHLDIAGVVLSKLDHHQKIGSILSLLMEQRLPLMALSKGLSWAGTLVTLPNEGIVEEVFRQGSLQERIERVIIKEGR